MIKETRSFLLSELFCFAKTSETNLPTRVAK